MAQFTRLRQVCLVAHDLEKVVGDLCAIFDVEVCHRDPNVERYGLVNALMPVGTSFIEVVSPIKPGPHTAAGRYLERRRGDGGYMVINDCDDVSRYRDRATALGIRRAEDRTYAGKADLLQLHPRDTGGAILEFDRHEGGAALDGAYHWAGEHWHAHVRTTRVGGIAGVELQADDPAVLAQKWSAIYGIPVSDEGARRTLQLENARFSFVPATDGRGEGLSAIALCVTHRAAIAASARERGLRVAPGDSAVDVCGTRFDLVVQEAKATARPRG